MDSVSHLRDTESEILQEPWSTDVSASETVNHNVSARQDRFQSAHIWLRNKQNFNIFYKIKWENLGNIK